MYVSVAVVTVANTVFIVVDTEWCKARTTHIWLLKKLGKASKEFHIYIYIYIYIPL